MKLSELQYSVLIQSLHNARDLHLDGEFIDPYAENEEGYTDEDIEKALNETEAIIMANWEPLKIN